jgi:8-oxo-dGTP pyrophosphatase MutT (NUDIX family)
LMRGFGLEVAGIWAAEHVYTIYNRRFEAMQVIAVFAAEVASGDVKLDPEEHAEHRWCPYDEAQRLIAYRGLKDGLASTREYVTGRATPLPELRLA